MAETKQAVIAQGVAGTNTIVPGIANRRVLVENYVFTLNAAGTLKFQSKGAGAATDISGPMDCAIAGGVVAPSGPDDAYYLETLAGEGLDITTTGGKASGHLTYRYE